ncbi:hypothetical protein WJX72_004958 [[Myrmecia] bisecta]|uniref:Uncharacterized protein n=1 Tax=[Myrmecia] bisecta TaxID=41462 RepID=A0AAW1PPC6_9CHLO
MCRKGSSGPASRPTGSRSAAAATRTEAGDTKGHPPFMRLLAFYEAAKHVEEVDGWLRFPKGVFLLGTPAYGSCILVPESYIALDKALQKEASNGRPFAVVSGNPGLGQVRLRPPRGCAVLEGSLGPIAYICDGTEPVANEELLAGVTEALVTHAPDEAVYHKFLKLTQCVASPFWLPPWSIDELEMLRLELYPHVSCMQMLQLVARYGPVPHCALARAGNSGLRGLDISLDVAIARLKGEDIECASPADAARTSRCLILIEVPGWREGDCLNYKVQLLSPDIKIRVAARLHVLYMSMGDRLRQLARLIGWSAGQDQQK